MHGLHRSTGSQRLVVAKMSGGKSAAWRALFLLGCLALMLMLTACDGQGSAYAPPGAPSSPVAQFQISTPPPVATVSFQVYTGIGLSLRYPQNWVVRTAGTVVSLSDASGTYNMTVSLTPNAHGQLTASQLADTNLASVKTTLSNPQPVAMPSSVKLAGTSWSQRAVSGTTLSNGTQVEREVIILAANHPAHATSTKGVVLIYMGVKQTFAQARNTYFIPMLQTFTFLA